MGLLENIKNNKTKQEVPTKVEEFLNSNIKDYGLYVVRTRALPSIMDGLRVGARKLFYAAHKSSIHKKPEKLINLMGLTTMEGYHHGEASLQNTAEFYSSPHLMNYHPLAIKGQIGTLRVPEVKTASRYLKVTTTPYFSLFQYDSELWDYEYDDGDRVEPKMLYPLIPTQLLQRTSSPGFGFSYSTFSYNLEGIIDNCILSISNGTCLDKFGEPLIPLIPTIDGIKPENIIYNKSKETWYNIGEYKIDGNKLIITDLPYSYNYDKFENILKDYEEKGFIKKWQNKSANSQMLYEIEFFTGQLEKLYSSKWKFYQKFCLYTKIRKTHLNVLDLNGKNILYFENEYKLIDAFILRRLTIYQKRKKYLIQKYEEELNILKDKSKFLKLIIDGKLVINNRKLVDIKSDLVRFEVSQEGLKLPISKLTKEEYDKYISEIMELEQKINDIKNTTEKEMYIRDLIDLRIKFGLKPKTLNS